MTKQLFTMPHIMNELIKNREYKHKDEVFYAYLLHVIIHSTLFNKKSIISDYVPLNSKLMTKRMGRKYYQVKNNLISWGIILPYLNSNGKQSYEIGRESKKYKIAHHNNPSLLTIKIKTYSSKLFSKTKKLSENYIKSQITTDTIGSVMYNKLLNVKLDEKLTLDYIESIKSNLSDHQYNYMAYTTKLFNNDIVFSTDNVGRRHYTNLTNLSKSLRQFIYFDNDMDANLYEIDIKNSQPLLLNKLIDDNKDDNVLYMKPIKSSNIINKLDVDIKTTSLSYRTIIDVYNISKPVDRYNILAEMMKYNKINKSDNTIKYKTDSERGEIYDIVYGDLANGTNRKQIKHDFFKYVLFSKYIPYMVNEIQIKFIEQYPWIWNTIIYYKKNKHSNLAVKLQQLESNIVISNTAANLIQEYDITLATIHDSIICKKEHISLVKNKLIKSMKSYNLNPSLTIKSL